MMAQDDPKHEKDENKPRGGSTEPSSDSPAGSRPLSEDEKIDEAMEETFVASDPPAYSSPSRVGTPLKRRPKKKNQKK